MKYRLSQQRTVQDAEDAMSQLTDAITAGKLPPQAVFSSVQLNQLYWLRAIEGRLGELVDVLNRIAKQTGS